MFLWSHESRTMETWNYRIVEHFCGSMNPESWKHGTTALWNHESMFLWFHESRTAEPWKHGTTEL